MAHASELERATVTKGRMYPDSYMCAACGNKMLLGIDSEGERVGRMTVHTGHFVTVMCEGCRATERISERFENRQDAEVALMNDYYWR